MQRRAVCAREALFVSPLPPTLPNLGAQRWPPAGWPARARETPRRQLRPRRLSCASSPALTPSPKLRLSAPEKARRAAHRCAKAPITARARGGYGPRPAGIADAASTSLPPQPHGSLVHAHVNCSRWRVVWHLSCVQLPKLDMLLRRLHRDRRLHRVRPPPRLQSRRPRWLPSQSCGG